MSAIFGIIYKKAGTLSHVDSLKMQESLLHRAVDGQSVYACAGVMFGHYKLNVNRRQVNERQPLEMDDCIITCDTRLDNFEELQQQLEVSPQDGLITDPFLILKAFRKWGSDCVNFLQGEFAFAIWDQTTQTFFGASDQTGFRTFYYYENADIFAFSSEMRGLEAIKKEPLVINEAVFVDYFSNILHPITYDKKIQVLPSAHCLLLDKSGRLFKQQYWQLKETKRVNANNGEDYTRQLIQVVTKKIRAQVETDYPVGILLSGGLDSSFIAAIACTILKETGRKLLAFCSVLPLDYQGADTDERYYIELLREVFDNLEVHYIVIPKEKGPYSDVDHSFDKTEGLVNIFHYVDTALYETAERLGVRTILTGYGGDVSISSRGGGLSLEYFRGFQIRKGFKSLLTGYRHSSNGLMSYFRDELLGHTPVYRKVRNFVKHRVDYKYVPLNRKIISRIRKEINAQETTFKTYFRNSLNSGELGSEVLRIRKHVNRFKQEICFPFWDKEVNELFYDAPGELFYRSEVGRNFIRAAMAGLVPDVIRLRTKKHPFSPDYNTRIAQMTIPALTALLGGRTSVPGIDTEKLRKLIAQMEGASFTSQKKFTPEIYYIPQAVITINFYLWLLKKSTLGL